jgi:predicted DNA-binding ribbon-helix-helix protein
MSGPIKRSVTIAGHETSISLEPIFWDALKEAASEKALPINALIAQIDVERIAAKQPANLGSAIRVWLFERARQGTVVDLRSPSARQARDER